MSPEFILGCLAGYVIGVLLANFRDWLRIKARKLGINELDLAELIEQKMSGDIFIVSVTSGEECPLEEPLCYFSTEKEAKKFVEEISATVQPLVQDFREKCHTYGQAMGLWQRNNPLPQRAHQQSVQESKDWFASMRAAVGPPPELKITPLSGTTLHEVYYTGTLSEISFSYYKVSPGSSHEQ